jgi:Lrp/AsnC family transcriptional regulator, regulator for asnA, asnC and gidA
MRTRSGCGKMELDDTDRKLIKALQEDGRYSMRALSDMVGVALGTVSNRLTKLEDSGVITGYTVEIDADKVGWEMTVVVGLRIVKGELLPVQRKIAADGRVFAVYDVTGEMDSLVFARVKDRDDLDNFTKTVLSTEGVERSETMVVLNTVKESGVSLPNDD